MNERLQAYSEGDDSEIEIQLDDFEMVQEGEFESSLQGEEKSQ
jgi:hypothetical protein